MGYKHTNSKGKTYFLHSKDVELKGGRNQTIYYFAKDERLKLVTYQLENKLLKVQKQDYHS